MVAVMVAGAPALAETLNPRLRSAVFMEVISARGVECGLLAPWEGAALRVQMIEELSRLSEADRAAVTEAAAVRGAQTPCDSPSITTWIEAAQPNMDTEMLPPHLLVYRALTERDPRPDFFTARTGTVDVAAVRAAVDAKIADYAASGARFEGGKPWDAYATRTGEQIEAVIGAATGTGPAGFPPERARAMLEQAIEITHIWAGAR